MTRLQTELATLDLDKALATDPAEDGETGEDHDWARGDSDRRD